MDMGCVVSYKATVSSCNRHQVNRLNKLLIISTRPGLVQKCVPVKQVFYVEGCDFDCHFKRFKSYRGTTDLNDENDEMKDE